MAVPARAYEREEIAAPVLMQQRRPKPLTAKKAKGLVMWQIAVPCLLLVIWCALQGAILKETQWHQQQQQQLAAAEEKVRQLQAAIAQRLSALAADPASAKVAPPQPLVIVPSRPHPPLLGRRQDHVEIP